GRGVRHGGGDGRPRERAGRGPRRARSRRRRGGHRRRARHPRSVPDDPRNRSPSGERARVQGEPRRGRRIGVALDRPRGPARDERAAGTGAPRRAGRGGRSSRRSGGDRVPTRAAAAPGPARARRGCATARECVASNPDRWPPVSLRHRRAVAPGARGGAARAGALDAPSEGGPSRPAPADARRPRPGGSGGRLTPERVVALAREATEAGTIATLDAGPHAAALAGAWDAVAPGEFVASYGPATVGFALPAAIAAHLVHPERRAVCFTGGAGFRAALSELPTAIRL